MNDQTPHIQMPIGALQARRALDGRKPPNLKVNVNARRLTESGNTAFHIAVNNNFPHLIKPLAQAGDECEPVNTRNRGT